MSGSDPKATLEVGGLAAVAHEREWRPENRMGAGEQRLARGRISEDADVDRGDQRRTRLGAFRHGR